ncbi:MAG: type II secretion system F family protein [Lactobacillus sp.]|nr:type II secretion system F family protein [Lactobacillus sp.]
MNFMSNTKKDRLNQQEQLTLLEFLGQSLKNGFSLHASLEMLLVFWPERAKTFNKLNQQLASGSHFQELFENLGFGKTIVVQLVMSLSQGSIEESLLQLAELERLKREQVKKLLGQLSYPFILVFMMIFLLIFMSQITSFGNQGAGEGNGIIFGIVLLLVLGCLVGIYCWQLLRKQDYWSLKKLLRVPIIGKLVKHYVSYLLVYDLGMLLKSGFSLQQICDFGQKQSQGSVQEVIASRMAEQLVKGVEISEIIRQEEFLPNRLILLLNAGSDRELLGRQCQFLGRNLFFELTEKISRVVVNIQPICFVFIGICIIGMYLKLLLPMYSMMQGI